MSSSGSSPRKTRSTRFASRGRLTLPPTLTRVSVPSRSSQSVVSFSRKRDSAISVSLSTSPKKLSTQRVSAKVRSVAKRWLVSTQAGSVPRSRPATSSSVSCSTIVGASAASETGVSAPKAVIGAIAPKEQSMKPEKTRWILMSSVYGTVRGLSTFSEGYRAQY